MILPPVVFPALPKAAKHCHQKSIANVNYDLKTPLFHLEDVYLTGMLAEKCGFQGPMLLNFFVRYLRIFVQG